MQIHHGSARLVAWAVLLAGGAVLLVSMLAMHWFLRRHGKRCATRYDYREPFNMALLYRGITSREQGRTGGWFYAFIASLILLVVAGLSLVQSCTAGL